MIKKKEIKETKVPRAAKVSKVSRAEVTRTPRRSSKLGEPQSMDELLVQTGYKLFGWRKGTEVEGTVIEKTKKAMFLDIGGKSEGVVPEKEIRFYKDYVKNIKLGDKIRAVIFSLENENGQALLSLRKAASDSVWQEFEEKLKTKEPLRVIGREVNKGGLIVDAKSLQGFIPASQFAATYQGRIGDLVGKEAIVKVIEVDRATNRLIFSEKEVSESGLIEALKDTLSKVKTGDILEGEVKGVMPFGLFVKVKVAKVGKKAKTAKTTEDKDKDKESKGAADTVIVTLEGLVHISEISWEKVEDPGKLYKEGDKVKVRVLAVDDKTARLNLSLKRLQTDPWEEIAKKYPVDAKVKGEVIRMAPFGVFVRLEPGVEALIHISKVPAGKTFEAGEKVNCYVESTDKNARRMSLGLVLKEKPVGYK